MVIKRIKRMKYLYFNIYINIIMLKHTLNSIKSKKKKIRKGHKNDGKYKVPKQHGKSQSN